MQFALLGWPETGSIKRIRYNNGQPSAGPRSVPPQALNCDVAILKLVTCMRLRREGPQRRRRFRRRRVARISAFT